MKKLIILSAIALATGGNLFAQNFLVLDSLISQDSVAGSWVKNSKETFVWNIFGLQVIKNTQTWNGMAWQDYVRHYMEYDANRNATNFLQLVWNGASWDSTMQFAFTYDANNNLTSTLLQMGSSNLQNISLQTSTYDANQKLINDNYKAWDNGASAWVDSTQNIYSHDSSGNQISNIIQDWDGTAWVNDSQVVSTYDTSGRVMEVISLNWYVNTWVTLYRDTITYDANGKELTRLAQYWSGTWINRWINLIYRSADGDSMVNELNYWDGTQWTDGPIQTETFYPNGIRKTLLNQQWNGTTHMNWVETIDFYNSFWYPQSQIIRTWDTSGVMSQGRWDWHYRRNPGCSADFLLYADTIPHHYIVINLGAGTPDLTYHWSWGDGTYDSTAYPSHTYDTAGLYTICLTVTDSARCGAMQCDTFNLSKMMYSMINITVIPDSSVGVNHYQKEETFILIAPNPAGNQLSITLTQPVSSATTNIFNLIGERVAAGIINGKQAHIDVSELAPGTYILQVNTGSKIFSQKFVKGHF